MYGQQLTNLSLSCDVPLWWGKEETKEVFLLMLSDIQYKYAKKVYHGMFSSNLYYGTACMSFDIEDSSFYPEFANDGLKVATMYVWQFGFNGVVFMGRQWKEFRELIQAMKDEVASISDENNEYRLIIYVHFLDHEFQFIRRQFKWSSVFSRKNRSPIYAVTGGVEFRDSYILTGKSLAKVAEDLREGDLHKKIGDLDYNLIRGCETLLTEKEIGYCMADVQILNEMEIEKIEDEGGNVGRIPLTNTGYVRRFVRRKCLPTTQDKKEENIKYFNYIHSLTIEKDEYMMLKRAFQGGFTHANALYVGDRISGRIDSIDFTSSYPAQILANKYPCSKGRLVHPKDQEEFDYYIKEYLSVFTISFINLNQKAGVADNIISGSKCVEYLNHKKRSECDIVVNNGRIVSGKEVTTTITNIDFDCIKKFYTYDKFYIGDMWIYGKDYLPKPIIESVLDLYKAKTELKGVEGSEVEYMLKKGMLNSVYGMMVTDVMKDQIICDYDGEWQDSIEPDVDEALEKYNNNKRRFLYFPWGCFVTAYARRALYTGLLEFGHEDYIYSDTDSIKCLNIVAHMTYIKNYNRYITDMINKCLDHYNIPEEYARPKNKKGEEKQIGIWDWETKRNPYTEFKTLGAKRYIYMQNNELHITIAGVSKRMGRDYIQGKDDPFSFFADEMEIDDVHSGKLTHTYLDYAQDGILTDYKGNKMKYHEDSSVHLERSSYVMSIIEEFKDYVKQVKKEVDLI